MLEFFDKNFKGIVIKKKKIQQRITNTLETNGKKRSREVENIKKNQIEILGLINAIIKIKIQLN